MTVEKLYPRSAWDTEVEPSMSILPTPGRSIHWQDARATRWREVFVTGLDYGPAVKVTAILGRDYTEGDPFNTRLPAADGIWHYGDGCDGRLHIAKS